MSGIAVITLYSSYTRIASAEDLTAQTDIEQLKRSEDDSDSSTSFDFDQLKP